MNGADFTKVGRCRIDPTATICPGAIIGKQFRPLIGASDVQVESETVVGPNAYVGYYSVVGAGSVIGAGTVLDDFTVVECEVILGDRTLAIYRAQICNEARIGSECVIGGFVAERVIVGNKSRIFGKVIHSQHNPKLSWDTPEAQEPSATIGDQVFIGFDAVLTGQLVVESGAYICAGAIVTRNVPTRCIASGMNRIVPFSEWRGPLAHSEFFDKET